MMAVMAEWLTKKWEVSPERIAALENLTTSYKLKANTNNDAAGKPSTNLRVKELQKVSLDTLLSDSVGINILTELTEWEALIGQSGPLIIGGRKFGPDKFMLMQIDVSGVRLDDSGRFRIAKIKLSFQEDAPEAVKAKPNTGATGTGNGAKTAPGVSGIENRLKNGSANSETKSALGIGPSTGDKAALKPSNANMF